MSEIKVAIVIAAGSSRNGVFEGGNAVGRAQSACEAIAGATAISRPGVVAIQVIPCAVERSAQAAGDGVAGVYICPAAVRDGVGRAISGSNREPGHDAGDRAGEIGYHHVVIARVGQLSCRNRERAIRGVAQTSTAEAPLVGQRRRARGGDGEGSVAVGRDDNLGGLCSDDWALNDGQRGS